MRAYLIYCAVALLTMRASANHIQVTNANLTGNNSAEGSVLVQFDISWENSWRGGGVMNWDAAWVFVKYRTSNGQWHHVELNNSGHVVPAGCLVEVGLLSPGAPYSASSNPIVGVFIRRETEGNGTFTCSGVRLSWNYASLGLAYNDIAEVHVFALEMVNVLQGGFYLGSGGTETGSFTRGTWSSGPTIPYHVASESSINVGTNTFDLWGTSTNQYSTIGPAGVIPQAFPKGYASYYCMKYEISQQGYVDFLNTLTYDQQASRAANAPSATAGTGALIEPNAGRNGIDIQTPGAVNATPAVFACNLNGNTSYGEADDGMDIACNWLSWSDVAAYLDWSGLRPMTEFEFEKACRGTLAPVPDEFAWGTAGIATAGQFYALANSGFSNEDISSNYSTTLGNAIYAGTDGSLGGPLRVGIFAANGSSSGRVTSGATYYGVMEMNGNVTERVVTVGNAEGRSFTGRHGDGSLTPLGVHDPIGWPDNTALGIGFRGGYWNNSDGGLRVSNRVFAVQTLTNREDIFGGRGVRTAP